MGAAMQFNRQCGNDTSDENLLVGGGAFLEFDRVARSPRHVAVVTVVVVFQSAGLGEQALAHDRVGRDALRGRIDGRRVRGRGRGLADNEEEGGGNELHYQALLF